MKPILPLTLQHSHNHIVLLQLRVTTILVWLYNPYCRPLLLLDRKPLYSIHISLIIPDHHWDFSGKI